MENPSHPSPWMTRREAGEYLRISTDTVDRLLTEMAEGLQEGKLRYSLLGRRVRILAEDVYAMLPLPQAPVEEPA